MCKNCELPDYIDVPFIQGDTGDKGDTGAAGADGSDGSNGVAVVYYNNDLDNAGAAVDTEIIIDDAPWGSVFLNEIGDYHELEFTVVDIGTSLGTKEVRVYLSGNAASVPGPTHQLLQFEWNGPSQSTWRIKVKLVAREISAGGVTISAYSDIRGIQGTGLTNTAYANAFMTYNAMYHNNTDTYGTINDDMFLITALAPMTVDPQLQFWDVTVTHGEKS